ncbi:F-box domain [Macleaya cordata]|uniref:F-box domain n=1 Tax=Macleaya cordata TaxID=56857 RepID=A0A200PYU1_MACCD|nr:F-box domain [Macleaya cordata]
MATSIFPEEIMVDILSRLPVKSIKRFRCVCKPWCDLFSSPNFVKMHLNHHSIEKDNLTLLVNDGCHLYTVDYDSSLSTLCDIEAVKIDYPLIFPEDRYGEVDETSYPLISSDNGVEILGSCNGILCFTTHDNDVIFLWNPSTKEHKKLQGAGYSEYFRCSIRVPYGFGYGCKIDDYKLVSIFYNFRFGSEVEVYTLGSNSWKKLKNIPYIVSSDLNRPGVLVNECLHWIASPNNGLKKNRGSKDSKVIVSFDINDEIFLEVSHPEQLDDKFGKHLGVLGGCLCLVSSLAMDDNVESVDVWVMKEYGVRESWTKMFTIAQETLGECIDKLRPIQSFKNGKILLETEDNDTNALVLYDPKHETSRVLNIRGILEGWEWFETESYVRSLVPLKSRKLKKKNKKRKAIENMKCKKTNKKR